MRTTQKQSLRQQARQLAAALAQREALIFALLEEAKGQIDISPETITKAKTGTLTYKTFRVVDTDGGGVRIDGGRIVPAQRN